MIEVLKSRHSSLFRSPRVAVILLMHFYPDIICISSLSSPATFFGGWGVEGGVGGTCLIDVMHLLQALVLIAR